MRGKALGCLCLHGKYAGSPPPMRGKGPVLKQSAFFAGITPAYAGKRDWHVHEATRPKDHPRLCGEKLTVTPPSKISPGSPPPMRGKVQRLRWRARRYRDHPRLCGEKFGIVCCENKQKGSPPPMRGKETNDCE